MTCLAFHGAARTVTGSKYLLDVDGSRVLVDCGLFQGRKSLRIKNWERPPFDVSTIDAVVLTHAHIDHTGYLPRLAKLGYKGPIHATPATTDLCDLLLRDAAKNQEDDAASSMAATLESRWGWKTVVPQLNEQFDLEVPE